MSDFPFGAIGQLIGGHFDREAAEDQQNRNIDLQREFAQNSISWKVADAVRAGLHPLVGAGAQGALFTPNPIVTGDMAGAGQALGNAISRSSNNDERAMRDAQLSLLRMQAAKEFSQAAYYDSEAARNRQGARGSIAVPSVQDESAPVIPGQIEVKPSEVVSASKVDATRRAGENPLWQTERVAPGVDIDIPRTSEPGETLSEMGPGDLGFWMTLSRNIKKHGALWPWEVLRGERFEPGPLDVPHERVGRAASNFLRKLKAVMPVVGAERPRPLTGGWDEISHSYMNDAAAKPGKFGRRSR